MSQIESFGKYLLLERLAAGGMAEVYLAKSSGASGVAKFLAIKRILPQYSDNPEFIDMFKEEAKIAINLSHANVVSIYEFGVEAKQFYIVMEYLEGQNLRQILNHLKREAKEFSIDQVVYIIKQVAAGLDHAHRCLDGSTGKPLNITHRDMSPQNIMISFEGEVKVVDFGIAKAESQLEQTRAGTIKGKFGYMSPEQAEGHVVDSRTDIFSLGIILWELLAKDRLFTAPSEAATLRKIRECQVPPLRRINPNIPAELERICNKALSKELSLRYQSCADLHRDLNRFLNTSYPEFSSQDFSYFMKNSFAEMFLENRRKQVEYAKAKPSLVEDRTQVVNTQTNTNAEREPTNYEAPVANAAPDELPAPLENLDFGSLDKARVDLSGLKSADGMNRPVVRKSAGFNQHTWNANKPQGLTSSVNYEHSKKLKVAPPSKSFTSKWAGPAIALSLLVGIGFWSQKSKKQNPPSPSFPAADRVNPNSRELTETGGLPAQESPTQQTVAQIELPSTQAQPTTSTVVIEASPKPARLYIDGKDTGLFTPVRRQLPADREVKIGLSADGYKYYEKIEKFTKDGIVFKAALEPLPKMGYISITAVNAGMDPIVYINEQRVAQKLPIRLYGVPADQDMKIKITNPFAQVTGEAVVKVGASERKDIVVILEPDSKN